MKYKYITVIPARGGSKRFPGKNIYPFNGKPLICSSIDYAQRESSISRVFVSTDSDEIKNVALQAGAEVIDRPKELSGDFVSSAEVMQHAARYLLDHGVEYDFVVLLQATNPLRPAGMLREAIEIIEKGDNDSLFTVSRSSKKLGKIDNGLFVPWNYHFGQRSQDLEPLYYENGLLYISSKQLLLEGIIEGPSAYPFIVDHPFGDVDIDTREDMTYAEFMLDKYGV